MSLIGIASATSQARDRVPSCPEVADSAEATVLQWETLRQPRELGHAFDYADLLMDAGCYETALAVLTRTEQHRPQNLLLTRRLEVIRLKMREAAPVQSPQSAAPPIGGSDRARCLEANDASACDQALRADPGSVALHAAKAQALLNDNRPARAIPVAKSALKLEPDNAAVKKVLDDAHIARKLQLDHCMQESDADALQSCSLARIPGDVSDFAIIKRTAQLHQLNGESAQALDQYTAAHLLKNDDQSVAAALIALTHNLNRTDAHSLAVLGSAMIAQRRLPEARTALQRALATDPELALARELLRQTASADPEADAPTAAAATLARIPARAPTVVAGYDSDAERDSNQGPVYSNATMVDGRSL